MDWFFLATIGIATLIITRKLIRINNFFAEIKLGFISVTVTVIFVIISIGGTYYLGKSLEIKTKEREIEIVKLNMRIDSLIDDNNKLEVLKYIANDSLINNLNEVIVENKILQNQIRKQIKLRHLSIDRYKLDFAKYTDNLEKLENQVIVKKRRINDSLQQHFILFVKDYPRSEFIELNQNEKDNLTDKNKACYLLMKASDMCRRKESVDSIKIIFQQASNIINGQTWKSDEYKKLGKPFVDIRSKIKKNIKNLVLNNARVSIEKEINKVKIINRNISSIVTSSKDFDTKRCYSPNLRIVQSKNINSMLLVVDFYMCTKNLNFSDRLHIGKLGERHIYDSTFVFIYNNIVVNYMRRKNITREKALSNINIVIEGHTDGLKVGRLDYFTGQFNIPKNTIYVYEERGNTSILSTENKKTDRNLSDRIMNNRELGLARAFVVKEILDNREITNNQLIIKSINHPYQRGNEFRKVSISIEIKNFYSNMEGGRLVEIKKRLEKLFPSNDIVTMLLSKDEKVIYVKSK